MYEELPSDPFILLSYINTLLRDEYADGGLDALCQDRGIERKEIEKKLGDAGFEYNREQNRFF